MVLNENETLSIAKGYRCYEKIDGYYDFHRFSDNVLRKFEARTEVEPDFFKWASRRNSSIHLDFYTDAKSFSFKYKFIYIEQGTMDLIVNGRLIKSSLVKDLPNEGEMSYTLDGKYNHVLLYFSINACMLIKDINIDGKYNLESDYRANVILIGDSISAGAGAEHCYKTYANTIARELKLNLFNQSVGGFWFEASHTEKYVGFDSDLIIVSYGTNMIGFENIEEKIKETFSLYKEFYLNKKFLIITPIPRLDSESNNEKLREISSYIIKHSEGLKRTIVDGSTLVPKDPMYYLLDGVHPNDLGHEMYSTNLKNYIDKMIEADK